VDVRARDRRTVLALVFVSLVSLAPFARGLAGGRCFYFRDLASIFIPVRTVAAAALERGQLRYWNPLDHEGVPLPHPPLSYPIDALQALLPGPFGITLLLALHVPLAAAALFALARALGASRVAAAGAGLVYALGGFSLSTISLYVYIQAAAWVPFVVLAMLRIARGGRRLCWAALAIAILASTMALEFLIQALVIGCVLGLWQRDDAAPGAGRLASRVRAGVRPLGRLVSAAVLGMALAAPTLLVMRAVLRESARGTGLAPSVTLAHSLHPFTLLQILVADLYGDMARPVDRWWGVHFFPRGFPYFVSLYLGATVIAIAWTGMRHGTGPRRRLMLLALLGTVVCLGRFAGLEPLVEALPLLSAIRYPTKAFLTVHLALALLAALGWDASARSGPRAWRSLALAGCGLGGILVLLPTLLPLLLPAQVQWFQGAFFPDVMPGPERQAALALMGRDAATGGALALCAGALALATAFGRVRADLARLSLVGLVAADLVRAGAGLNPMTHSSFFGLSSEMRAVAEELRAEGRAFVCQLESTDAYWQARALHRADHELWTFALMLETFTPHLNMLYGVPTALGEDQTSLVPLRALPVDAAASCARFEAVAARVRAAAVSHVIALDPIDSPSLQLERVLAPARVAPAAIRIYRVLRPLPRASVARSVISAPTRETPPDPADQDTVLVEGTVTAKGGARGRVVQMIDEGDRLELAVETDRPTVVLLRDTWTPGWTARVNGQPAPVLRANGLHRAVPVPAGSTRVVLAYEPPGLATGILIALAALLVLGLFEATAAAHARRARRRDDRERPPADQDSTFDETGSD
jgi:hypothetical protein